MMVMERWIDGLFVFLTSWDLAACLASLPGLEKAKALGFCSTGTVSINKKKKQMA